MGIPKGVVLNVIAHMVLNSIKFGSSEDSKQHPNSTSSGGRVYNPQEDELVSA